VFIVEHRDELRRRLLRLAEQDARITGAAITGSAADGREDRWSDIDLFFGVAEGVPLHAVLSDWSDYLYGEVGALHHKSWRSCPRCSRGMALAECQPRPGNLAS